MPRTNRKLPARWDCYTPMGMPIEGTNIICFKTPLKPDLLNNKVDKEHWFTTTQCLQLALIQTGGLPLGLVVDLTATDRYYDASDFTEQCVAHVKLPIYGHTANEQERIVKEFMKVMSKEESRLVDNGQSVGVHCTHGVNRTGYLICRYLIEKKRWSYDDAINAFSKARGYPIERENYLQSLKEIAARPADTSADNLVDEKDENSDRSEKGDRSEQNCPQDSDAEQAQKQKEKEKESAKRKAERRARKDEAKRAQAAQLQQQMQQIAAAMQAQQLRNRQIQEYKDQMRQLQERNAELERQRIALIERQQAAERAVPRRRGRFRPVARDADMEDISSSDEERDEAPVPQQKSNAELRQVNTEQAELRQQLDAMQRHVDGLSMPQRGAAPVQQQQPNAAAMQQMMQKAMHMHQAMQRHAPKQQDAQDVSSDEGDAADAQTSVQAEPVEGADDDGEDSGNGDYDPDGPQTKSSKRRARRRQLDAKWRVLKRGNIWEINALQEDELRAQAEKVARLVEKQMGYAPSPGQQQ